MSMTSNLGGRIFVIMTEYPHVIYKRFYDIIGKKSELRVFIGYVSQSRS